MTPQEATIQALLNESPGQRLAGQFDPNVMALSEGYRETPAHVTALDWLNQFDTPIGITAADVLPVASQGQALTDISDLERVKEQPGYEDAPWYQQAGVTGAQGLTALSALPVVGAVTKGPAKAAAKLAKGWIKGKPAVVAALRERGMDAPDMVRSIGSKPVKLTDLDEAVAKRQALLQESNLGVHNMSPEELSAFGQQYGVNLDTPQPVDVLDPGSGKSFSIPGGLDSEDPLTLTDQAYLKSRAYDPNEMSTELQSKLQRRMAASNTPKDVNDQVDMFNRVMFGMQSPNTPLMTNQLMTNRMRATSVDDIQKLADMVPWKPGEKVSAAQRRALDKEIGKKFGIEKSAEGGMGMRSSADLTNVAEMAKLNLEHPEFFKRKPDEPWQDYAERVIAVQRGLAPKTGSFGVVWEDPGKASTSAMDRHMARKFRPTVMDDPVLGPATKAQRVELWNSQVPKARKLDARKRLTKLEKDSRKGMPPKGATRVKSYEELIAREGAEDWDLDQMITDSNKHSNPKYRLAKTGEINPAVPAHLRDLPIEPEKVTVFGPTYRRMLEENARSAQEQGLDVFNEQWRLWDRIRGQVEPHEAMQRDIRQLPKMGAGELMDAQNTLKKAKFDTTNKAKPFDWQKGLYWGGAGAAVIPMVQALRAGQDPQQNDQI